MIQEDISTPNVESERSLVTLLVVCDTARFAIDPVQNKEILYNEGEIAKLSG